MKIPEFITICCNGEDLSFSRNKVYYFKFSRYHNRYHNYKIVGYSEINNKLVEVTFKRIRE